MKTKPLLLILLITIVVGGALTLKGDRPDPKLYRGVPPVDNEKYRLAQLGIAKPRGFRLDVDALERHIKGEDIDSGVTSWSTLRAIALRFSGPSGIILEVELRSVLGNVVPRPPLPIHLEEHEILLRGIITARPTPASR
jgi:hypothetical protein